MAKVSYNWQCGFRTTIIPLSFLYQKNRPQMPVLAIVRDPLDLLVFTFSRMIIQPCDTLANPAAVQWLLSQVGSTILYLIYKQQYDPLCVKSCKNCWFRTQDNRTIATNLRHMPRQWIEFKLRQLQGCTHILLLVSEALHYHPMHQLKVEYTSNFTDTAGWSSYDCLRVRKSTLSPQNNTNTI